MGTNPPRAETAFMEGFWRNARTFIAVIGAVVALAGPYYGMKFRVDDLENRVAKVERANDELTRTLVAVRTDLDTLNHKLDLAIVCIKSPQECDEKLRLLGAIR